MSDEDAMDEDAMGEDVGADVGEDVREDVRAAVRRAVVARRADVLERGTGFVGECREKVPFGEMFSVLVGGREYVSCTHTPPHTHAVG